MSYSKVDESIIREIREKLGHLNLFTYEDACHIYEALFGGEPDRYLGDEGGADPDYVLAYVPRTVHAAIMEFTTWDVGPGDLDQYRDANTFV